MHEYDDDQHQSEQDQRLITTYPDDPLQTRSSEYIKSSSYWASYFLAGMTIVDEIVTASDRSTEYIKSSSYWASFFLTGMTIVDEIVTASEDFDRFMDDYDELTSTTAWRSTTSNIKANKERIKVNHSFVTPFNEVVAMSFRGGNTEIKLPDGTLPKYLFSKW
jgi:hypothetical protein